LPELKRVIAVYGDRVVMKETLSEALAALFGGVPQPGSGAPVAGAAADRARQALEHYRQAIERLKAADWQGFGAQLDAMRAILEQMSGGSR
jgi:uncharacterized membrane protein (UPF0182 family)